MNWLNLARTKGQHAPTVCPTVSERHAVRSLPVQTASTSRNFSAGTTVNHSKRMLTMVSRMLVGELNRRVRRKPTKPVVLTGGARSGTRSGRTKDEDDAAISLINPGSGQAAIRRSS